MVSYLGVEGSPRLLFKDSVSNCIEAIEGDFENGTSLDGGALTVTFSAVYFTIAAAINENVNYINRLVLVM